MPRIKKAALKRSKGLGLMAVSNADASTAAENEFGQLAPSPRMEHNPVGSDKVGLP